MWRGGGVYIDWPAIFHKHLATLRDCDLFGMVKNDPFKSWTKGVFSNWDFFSGHGWSIKSSWILIRKPSNNSCDTEPPPRFPKVSTKTTLSSAHSTLVAWVFLGLSYPLTYSLYHFIYGSPLTYHYNGISQAFWSQVINSTFFARLRCSMSQLSAQKGEQIRWDEPNVQPGEWLTWDFCFWKHLKTLGFLGIHMVDTPFFVIVMLLLGNSRCFYETYFLPAFF